MRVRYWMQGEWADSFDSLSAGSLPQAVEVALWFGVAAAPSEEDNFGTPDRVRTIAVPDAAGADGANFMPEAGQ
jgi:hypothetical protein